MRERERLLQAEQRAWLESVGLQEWTTVYHVEGDGAHTKTSYSALVPTRRLKAYQAGLGFDLGIGEGGPSCFMRGTKVGYDRFGQMGVEPLVLVRVFHDHRPKTVELLEEFRLFHNLSFDPLRSIFIKVDDGGSEEVIARIGHDHVDVKTYAVRQFLAIKRMHLSVGIDSRVFSPLALDEIPPEEQRVEVRRKLLAYEYTVQESFEAGSDTYSRLIGKHYIPPLPKEQSGIWPYNEAKQHEQFIIGRTEQGELREFTSDPEQLANYFGKNKGAPHCVTPVFFRRDVLTKYFAQPAKYAVIDGELTCGTLWSLLLDNNGPDYIIVHLGDLGRLPLEEQKYWRSYNVPPDGTVSEVHFRRSMLAQFTDAQRGDLVFKQRFVQFQEAWADCFGWQLFRPLHAGDAHHFTALRIPMTDDQAEFDGLVLSLTKLLNDSINEEALLIKRGVNKDVVGSINKLQEFLSSEGFADVDVHVKFLRNLQSLRSTGVGHRKGSGYEKTAAAVGIGTKPLSMVFADLLAGVTVLLDKLRAHFLAPAPSAP